MLDPYQRQQKIEDNTVCPQCGVVYPNPIYAYHCCLGADILNQSSIIQEEKWQNRIDPCQR